MSKLVQSFIFYNIPGKPKKLNKAFSYNSGCLAFIIRLWFNPPDALWLWHWKKGVLLLCISKCIRRETTEWKFLPFFVRDTKWVTSQTLSGCLAQPSTRSRSAWTVAKVSTDMQAVVERLLWIVTAGGIPYEAVPERRCDNMQGNLRLERRLFDELSLNSVCDASDAVMHLIRFPSWYRLTAGDYKAKLADKLVPWINSTFDFIYHCCASTGWCSSTHIQSRATLHERARFLLLVEKHVAAILARCQLTHCITPSGRLLRPGREMFVTQTLTPL